MEKRCRRSCCKFCYHNQIVMTRRHRNPNDRCATDIHTSGRSAVSDSIITMDIMMYEDFKKERRRKRQRRGGQRPCIVFSSFQPMSVAFIIIAAFVTVTNGYLVGNPALPLSNVKKRTHYKILRDGIEYLESKAMLHPRIVNVLDDIKSDKHENSLLSGLINAEYSNGYMTKFFKYDKNYYGRNAFSHNYNPRSGGKDGSGGYRAARKYDKSITMNFLQSFHWFDSKFMQIYSGPAMNAKDMINWYYAKAVQFYLHQDKKGNKLLSYEYLASAIHVLCDMTVPQHVVDSCGEENDASGNGCNHRSYEELVDKHYDDWNAKIDTSDLSIIKEVLSLEYIEELSSIKTIEDKDNNTVLHSYPPSILVEIGANMTYPLIDLVTTSSGEETIIELAISKTIPLAQQLTATLILKFIRDVTRSDEQTPLSGIVSEAVVLQITSIELPVNRTDKDKLTLRPMFMSKQQSTTTRRDLQNGGLPNPEIDETTPQEFIDRQHSISSSTSNQQKVTTRGHISNVKDSTPLNPMNGYDSFGWTYVHYLSEDEVNEKIPKLTIPLSIEDISNLETPTSENENTGSDKGTMLIIGTGSRRRLNIDITLDNLSSKEIFFGESNGCDSEQRNSVNACKNTLKIKYKIARSYLLSGHSINEPMELTLNKSISSSLTSNGSYYAFLFIGIGMFYLLLMLSCFYWCKHSSSAKEYFVKIKHMANFKKWRRKEATTKEHSSADARLTKSKSSRPNTPVLEISAMVDGIATNNSITNDYDNYDLESFGSNQNNKPKRRPLFNSSSSANNSVSSSKRVGWRGHMHIGISATPTNDTMSVASSDTEDHFMDEYFATSNNNSSSSRRRFGTNRMARHGSNYNRRRGRVDGRTGSTISVNTSKRNKLFSLKAILNRAAKDVVDDHIESELNPSPRSATKGITNDTTTAPAAMPQQQQRPHSNASSRHSRRRVMTPGSVCSSSQNNIKTNTMVNDGSSNSDNNNESHHQPMQSYDADFEESDNDDDDDESQKLIGNQTSSKLNFHKEIGPPMTFSNNCTNNNNQSTNAVGDEYMESMKTTSNHSCHSRRKKAPLPRPPHSGSSVLTVPTSNRASSSNNDDTSEDDASSSLGSSNGGDSVSSLSTACSNKYSFTVLGGSGGTGNWPLHTKLHHRPQQQQQQQQQQYKNRAITMSPAPSKQQQRRRASLDDNKLSSSQLQSDVAMTEDLAPGVNNNNNSSRQHQQQQREQRRQSMENRYLMNGATTTNNSTTSSSRRTISNKIIGKGVTRKKQSTMNIGAK